jgi:CheY-like chemotaxis protein
LPTSKKQILCVDDHADTCELVMTLLKDYEVTTAYSMADAIKQATAQKFDLYLLDNHLPDGTRIVSDAPGARPRHANTVRHRIKFNDRSASHHRRGARFDTE